MTLEEHLRRAQVQLRHIVACSEAAQRQLNDIRDAEQQAAEAKKQWSETMSEPVNQAPGVKRQWLEAMAKFINVPPDPPPIEVEMRVITLSTTDGDDTDGDDDGMEHAWQAWLGGTSIGEFYGAEWSCETTDIARAKGNDWLAALSEQLGVKLVAKWEGEEPAKTEAEKPTPEPDMHTCSVCGKDFDRNLPCWGNGALCSRECAVERGEQAYAATRKEVNGNSDD